MASRCNRGCGAPVIWATTPRGKNIPLDPEPVAGGNLELRAGIAMVVTADPEVRRYRSHFASCPKAGELRAPRPRKGRPAPPPPEVKQTLEQWKRDQQKRRHRGF